MLIGEKRYNTGKERRDCQAVTSPAVILIPGGSNLDSPNVVGSQQWNGMDTGMENRLHGGHKMYKDGEIEQRQKDSLTYQELFVS